MTSEKDFFIDLGNEVIRFAHEQGHTKASKSTINWKDLKSASGAAKFTTISRTTKTKTLTSSTPDSTTVFDHIDVNVENQSSDKKICDQKVAKSSINVSNSKITNCCPSITFKTNTLINKTLQPIACSLAINHCLKNTATAHAKLTGTLSCSNDGKSMARGKVYPLSKTKPKNSSDVDELLKRVPLLPKFSSRLTLTATKYQKIPINSRTKQSKAINLPSNTEARVDVKEYCEEEKGNFKVDYYLWGSVEVIVWGKPYTLMVSDILDTKHNPLFVRETLLLGGSKTPAPACKIVLHGLYELNQKYFELDVKSPIPIGLSGPKNEIMLYSRQKNKELPKLQSDQVAELNDKNLAKLLFRWKDELNPAQSKTNSSTSTMMQRKSNNTEQLWSLLLHHQTSIFAQIAQTAQIERFCKTSNAFDKLSLTLLLWKEESAALSELEQRKSWTTLELKQKSINIIKKLQEIGTPISVINCLLAGDGSNALPVQNGKKDSNSVKTMAPCLRDFHSRAQMKLQTPLPDRVLIRLMQRWPQEDGWIAAALYFETDPSNLLSLACNSLKATTIDEKRMTVLKLWRIKQRRKSDGLRKECTIWDLCKELNDLGLKTPIYSFFWIDSETTP